MTNVQKDLWGKGRASLSGAPPDHEAVGHPAASSRTPRSSMFPWTCRLAGLPRDLYRLMNYLIHFLLAGDDYELWLGKGAMAVSFVHACIDAPV